ncbi:MAG: hypothetical protein JXB62_07430 [Pirellulales bacterium]|nr:hypothetical protein [Pirellulales bacterium]
MCHQSRENDAKPEKCGHRQFGLRTLLLWIAMAAVLCGILRACRLDAWAFATLACGALTLVVAQIFCGARVAGWLSSVAGEFAGGFVYYLSLAGVETPRVETGKLLLLVAAGGLLGYAFSLLVGVVAWAIRWVDLPGATRRRRIRPGSVVALVGSTIRRWAAWTRIDGTNGPTVRPAGS